MAGVDQILSFAVQQGADEVRLGTDEEPQVFAKGVPRRFSMSPTPDPVLRQLLGDILTPDRADELERSSKVSLEHQVSQVGRFHVQLGRKATGGIVAVFRLVGAVQGTSSRANTSRTSLDSPHTSPAPPERPKQLAADAPVPSTLETPDQRAFDPQLHHLVGRAFQMRASDLHLADGQPVFLRVDGRLREFPDSPTASIQHLFGLGSSTIAAIRAGRALEFGLTLSPRERLRVSLYNMDLGLSAAIRLLPAIAPSLSDLAMPLPLQSFAELPHGLVLVCGATGSGKSTTLAALSRHAVENRSVLLLTLEDPIEYALSGSQHSLVRQRQIGRDVPDFSTGLRDALRSDPDIIVVGELRDADTIRLAITAAETGHLVLSSLHSGSAAACVERIIDAYPAEQRAQIRVQLADALRGVIVQRLIPRAKGQGRVPALEILKVNHGVANVIREAKTAQIGSMLQSGKREGMISLERCLAEYVQSGVTSLEHARAHANDIESLTMYLGK